MRPNGITRTLNKKSTITILDKIVEQAREDISKRKKRISYQGLGDLDDYERPRRDFAAALDKPGEVSVIAEIKKASPSKGIIREDFNPQRHAAQYQEAGASAISVLTDKPFFQGDLEYLKIVSRETTLPVLRKDFIVDFYQVREARAFGADAVLLIATITNGSQLSELHHAAEEAGLTALVECYSEEDIQKVDFNQIKVYGVNNRDLNTFKVDVHRGIELLNRAPGPVIKVSESGLTTREDLQLLKENKIHAALIGEHFMRQDAPGEGLKAILG
ncbi:MAG: indole-3-glycerol phosphate synthase TrpC [Balneolales bacterium]